jgi:hypothetical protein
MDDLDDVPVPSPIKIKRASLWKRTKRFYRQIILSAFDRVYLSYINIIATKKRMFYMNKRFLLYFI